jgi:hypothetical protein
MVFVFILSCIYEMYITLYMKRALYSLRSAAAAAAALYTFMVVMVATGISLAEV